MLFETAVCIEGRNYVVPTPSKEKRCKGHTPCEQDLSSCLTFPGHVTFGELVSTLWYSLKIKQEAVFLLFQCKSSEHLLISYHHLPFSFKATMSDVLGPAV